jgi:hypothetical protein
MSNNFAEKEKSAVLQVTAQKCAERTLTPNLMKCSETVYGKIVRCHGKSREKVSQKGSLFCVKVGSRFHYDRFG